MKKTKHRSKDPVFNPSATVFITGVSGERQSRSNSGSLYRELEVSIDRPDQPQSGNSYVDVSMENYTEQSWPNRIIVLQKGMIIGGTGVTRQNRDGNVYLDADTFEPGMVYHADGKPVDPNYKSIATDNFSTLFSHE
tara:strand:- start:4977 stop:5387 length:411 start_codon:yes stop_codon:yes gene_type:complete